MPCSSRMLKCKRPCGHREMVMEYRNERERQETEMEEATGNHPADVALYLMEHSLITFGEWLRGRARTDSHASGQDNHSGSQFPYG